MKLHRRLVYSAMCDLSHVLFAGAFHRATRGGRPSRARAARYSMELEALERRRLFSIYYVSTLGDDGNNGSVSNPFLTLQKAANSVVAGDTVIVRAGTYASGFVLGWDNSFMGTAAAPTVFEADPNAPAGSVIIAGRNNKTPDGIDLENGSDYVTIQGFTITNADESIYRAGIRVTNSDGVQILNNVCDHAGTWGIFSSFTSDVLIQGNTASNSQDQHGIYVSNSAIRPVVRNNLVFGNALQGIHLNGDVSQGGSGVITGALIENNIIRDNGSNGINADGLQYSRIQNNLIYGNAKHGISLYQIDASENSHDNFIVNNTIVQPDSKGAAVQLRDQSTGTILANNILIGGNYGALNLTDDSAPGLVSDYNIVGDLFRNDDSDDVYSLDEWQAAYGQDAHSMVASADDLFVNALLNDYHLSAGSVAINAGAGSVGGQAAPIVDFASQVRPMGGAFDIGAYESDGVLPLPNTTAPVLSAIRPYEVTDRSATIAWDTDETANTRVVFGTTAAYGSTSVFNGYMVTRHFGDLVGLIPSTLYHYQVQSIDSAGNLTVSGDNTFTTDPLHLSPPPLITPFPLPHQPTPIASIQVTPYPPVTLPQLPVPVVPLPPLVASVPVVQVAVVVEPVVQPVVVVPAPLPTPLPAPVTAGLGGATLLVVARPVLVVMARPMLVPVVSMLRMAV